MDIKKKQIAILGSTGSIGVQTLEVVRENADLFDIHILTANNNVDLLIKQALEFNPEVVVIANEDHYEKLKDALCTKDIKVWAGPKSIEQVVSIPEVDIVVTAMVGYSGLAPTINALKAKKIIALANKETLVVAGELIINLSKEYEAPIIPIDSEHSAIFQCLMGEYSQIDKLILTASGGPFRGYNREQLSKVNVKQALNHPNWEMGAKVTIDSASLMNKGFEMIEAKWLFDVNPQNIEVVVHPESIIHSMVQFADASVKAQLSVPTMKIPIQYALTFPNRIPSHVEKLDFYEFNSLNFEKPDLTNFRNLSFAYQAIEKGGNMPCILNAANEIAVSSFLREKISFLSMSDLIEETMSKVNFIQHPSYSDYIQTDLESRNIAKSIIGRKV